MWIWLTRRRLRSRNKRVRREAVQAIGRAVWVGPRRAPRLAELLRQATRDKFAEVRYAAAEAIGRLSSSACAPHLIDPLVELLEDEVDFVRDKAASALFNLNDHLPIAKRRMLQKRLASLLSDLDRLDPEVLDAILKVLDRMLWQPKSHTEKVNFAAARGRWGEIAKLGDFEALRRFFHGASDERRLAIVRALGWLGEPAASDFLLEALQDENAEVKQDALRALAKSVGPKALDALVEALGAPEEKVRAAAVDVLDELDDPKGVRALAEGDLLRDPNHSVRYATFRALERRDLLDDEAVRIALASGHMESQVLSYLEKRPELAPRFSADLVGSLNSKDRDQALRTARLLASCSDLDPAARTRAAVLRGDWGAVREIGREAVETLRSMLDEGEDVIEMLGDLADDARTLSALLSRLHKGELADSGLIKALEAIAARQEVHGLALFTPPFEVDSSLAEVRRRLTEDPDSFSHDELVRLSQLDRVVTCHSGQPTRADLKQVIEVEEIPCKDIAQRASRERARRAGK